MSSNVTIKGIKEGLLVTMGEGNWNDLKEALFRQIEDKAAFFQGARMALDVGPHVIHAAEMGVLRDRLAEKNITLWAVLSTSQVTEHTAQNLGLVIRLVSARPETEAQAEALSRMADTTISSSEERALFVQRTLRSGYKIEFPGHVTVVGDVNAGAEVIAGGSVLIWGKLRGVVHAGAGGDEKAVVCAMELTPTQLRIASKVAIPPKRKGKLLPEMAFIQDGQVVAEEWTAKGK
ncbi:MAG TPA: septum site-determining protein MinC [Anaerolineaceae bacterium]|nr:septum site-determining protein MinC [Anaerolineaceae bacterium]HPN53108.1 septum site-determining protein MinC [Anaerolineaceae bacterium]